MSLILFSYFWRAVFIIATALAIWLPIMAIMHQKYIFAAVFFIMGLMVSYLTFDKADN